MRWATRRSATLPRQMNEERAAFAQLVSLVDRAFSATDARHRDDVAERLGEELPREIGLRIRMIAQAHERAAARELRLERAVRVIAPPKRRHAHRDRVGRDQAEDELLKAPPPVKRGPPEERAVRPIQLTARPLPRRAADRDQLLLRQPHLRQY